ncbi:Unknown protein, partial [Striga hermonthica]
SLKKKRIMTNRERFDALEESVRSLGNGQHVVNENMTKLELMIHDLAGQLERVNHHTRRSRTSRSTMAGMGSSTSSRDDDDERSRGTCATRTTRHHCDRRMHGHRHHREEHVRAKPKITMPTFEGVDPDAWLSRAMQFFEINEVHKSERVQIAAYYLDGEANTWWQWVSHVYKNKGEQIRWRDFEKELIARFGSSEYFDYDEVLTRIRQTGSLCDYQKEFERIASRVRDWPEKALVGAFVGGLKAELAVEVRLDRPRSTRAAMEAARLHEDHLVAVRRARPSEGRTDVRRASVVVNDTPPRAEVKPTVGDGTRTTSNYRRLTEDEIQRRREKGLCFTCNEKFAPGYKCKGKEIFVLESEEEREEEKPQEDSWLHMVKCNKRGPRMIRFTVEIKDMLLEVLVDSGSSLNFIDEKIAQKLKLVPTKVKKFGVKCAHGVRHFYAGRCSVISQVMFIMRSVSDYSVPVSVSVSVSVSVHFSYICQDHDIVIIFT